MKTMAAAKFKEQCLSVLDHLDPDGLPTDELIAATSVIHRVPLITRDRRIRPSRMVPLA